MLTTINTDRDLYTSLSITQSIKYSKQVTSEDQFVPLFTCVPYYPGASSHYPLSTSAVFPIPTHVVFPTYYSLMQTGTPWLETVIMAVIERHVGSYRYDLRRSDHSLDSSVNTARANLINFKHIIENLTENKETIVSFVTRTIVSSACSWIPSPLIDYSSSVYKPTNLPWTYKIILSGHYTHGDEKTPISQSLTRNFDIPRSKDSRFLPLIVTRFGYIGAATRDGDVVRPNDLYSLACVMIRASKCPDMVCAFITGNFDALDLSNNDIELWEDPYLSDYLVGTDYEEYHKQYRVLMRNILRVSIKQKKNLSTHLFDVADTNNLSPIELKDFITRKLEDTAIVATVQIRQSHHDIAII